MQLLKQFICPLMRLYPRTSDHVQMETLEVKGFTLPKQDVKPKPDALPH